MSKLYNSEVVTLPAPTMGVDWSRLPEAVEWPFTPMSVDWLADGNSVKMRPPHIGKANTGDFFHLASFEAGGLLIGHIVSGAAGVVGTYSYNPVTEVATRIYTVNAPFGGHCNYQGRVFLAKTAGASSWDGTTFTAAAFTGASGGTSLPACCIYRDRYVQVQAQSLFYAASSGLVSGALSTFNLASYYTSGEFIAVAPITIVDSNNLSDYLIVLSSGGDILAFTGDFPGSANWQLVVKTKLDLTDYAPFGGKGMGLCPYAGDAWIYSRYPANIFSARELIQSGRKAAEEASPLRNQLNAIRRVRGALRNVTYKRSSNSLLIETQAGSYVVDKIFGYEVTNIVSNVWLNVDLNSGAVSPFSFPVVQGSLNATPFFNKTVSHTDGNVYVLADHILFKLWSLNQESDTGNYLPDNTFLQFPYSNLGVDNAIKTLKMAYINSYVDMLRLSLDARLSTVCDSNTETVASFPISTSFSTSQKNWRFVLPISGEGNLIGLALTDTYDSQKYCRSISIQFETGGPY
jgi:hypothetical protein